MRSLKKNDIMIKLTGTWSGNCLPSQITREDIPWQLLRRFVACLPSRPPQMLELLRINQNPRSQLSGGNLALGNIWQWARVVL